MKAQQAAYSVAGVDEEVSVVLCSGCSSIFDRVTLTAPASLDTCCARAEAHKQEA